MVVVDRFMKQANFVALQPHYTVSIVAEKLVHSVVRLHGFPHTIITDRDPIFLSKFWSQIMCSCGTELRFSTAYHPEFDGQTEVVNCCLEQYLRANTHQQLHLWYKFLTWAELWYNTS